MPTLEKLRIMNLGVRLARFEDLTLDFRSENTYILAENATGKSTIIGFILNTLSPYRHHFPRGDSAKDRKITQYIDPTNPGIISMVWKLDTSDEIDDKYLLIIRTLSMKTGTLRDKYFYKAYHSPPDLNLETLSIIEDDKYLTYTAISKKLRKAGFTQINQIQEWITKLSEYSLDHGITERLLQMNESENATKELISFRNEKEFINYLIDDIKPVPDYAADSLQNLKTQYQQLKRYPQIKKIISYLEDLKELMADNKNIYSSFNDLKEKVNGKLVELIKTKNTFEYIKQVLADMKTTTIEKKESTENQIQTTEQNLSDNQHEFKTLNVQYLRKRVNRLKSEKQDLEEKKAELSIRSQFILLYRDISDYEEIKRKIREITKQIEGTLGPIKERLQKVKDQLQKQLQQRYSYALYRKQEFEDNLSRIKSIVEDHTKQIGQAESKIVSLQKRRKENKAEIDKIDSSEQEIIGKIEDVETFDEAKNITKQKLQTEKDDLKNLRKETQDTRDQINKKDKQLTELNHQIEEAKREKNNINEKLEEIQDAWNDIVNTTEFQKRYSQLSIDSPQFNVVSQQSLNDLYTQIQSFKEKKLRSSLKYSNLKTKIEFFEEYEQFPTKDEIKQVIEFLKENNISVFAGWDWYNSNKEQIHDEWLLQHPYLFEGIIIQATSVSEVKSMLTDEGITGNYILSISNSELLLEQPPENLSSENFQFVHETIEWKFRPEMKKQHYQSLVEEAEELNNEIKQNKSKIAHREEFKETILQFNRITSEDDYSRLKVRRRELNSQFDHLDQKMDVLEQQKVQLQNKLSDLESQISSKSKSIKKLDQLKDEIIRLEGKIERKETLVSNNERITKDLQKINSQMVTYKKKLENKKNELEEVEKNLQEEKLMVQRLQEEYRNIFVDNPEDDPRDELPEKLDHLRQRYKDLQDKIEEDTEISNLQQEKNLLKDNLAQMDEKRDKFVRDHDISQDTFNQLMEETKQYTDLQEINTKLFEQKETLMEKISSLKQQLGNNRSELQDLRVTIDREIPETTLNEQQLVDKKTTLKEKIDQLRQNLEVLTSKLQQLKDKLETIEEDKHTCTEKLEEIENLRTTFISLLKRLQVSFDPETLMEKSSMDVTIDEKTYSKHMDNTIRKLKSIHTAYVDLNNEVDLFLEDQKHFRQELQKLIHTAEDDDYLQDFSVVEQLHDFSIDYIPTIIEECDSEIREREVELEKQKSKLEQIKSFLTHEVGETIRKIIEFQRTRISAPSTPNFNDVKPVIIDFSFAQKDIDDVVSSYLHDLLTNLNRFDEYPKEWEEYKPLVKSMVSEIIDNKINRIQFAIPEGQRVQHMDFEEAMRFSGGQTATLAVILYCYVAHFKIKFNRLLQDDPTKVSSTPISTIFINDNPIGAANREDLVRIQLDIAKSLNVQLIYFSGIGEEYNIEEFANKITLVKGSGNRVETDDTDNTVRTGLSFYHKPLRDVAHEEEMERSLKTENLMEDESDQEIIPKSEEESDEGIEPIGEEEESQEIEPIGEEEGSQEIETFGE